MAGDLRSLLTTLRVISELERSADLMVNVCKASRRVYDLDFTPKIRGLLEQMGVEAAFLIRTAIDSYVDADTSLAAALDDIDDRLDDLQVSYVEAIFESHQEDRPLAARRSAAGPDRPVLRADRRPCGQHRRAGASTWSPDGSRSPTPRPATPCAAPPRRSTPWGPGPRPVDDEGRSPEQTDRTRGRRTSHRNRREGPGHQRRRTPRPRTVPPRRGRGRRRPRRGRRGPGGEPVGQRRSHRRPRRALVPAVPGHAPRGPGRRASPCELDGPPALCVIAACLGAFGDPPELVLSGINPGLNTGRSTLHSGTVGAAVTAANFGRPGRRRQHRGPRARGGQLGRGRRAGAAGCGVGVGVGRGARRGADRQPQRARPPRRSGWAHPGCGALAPMGAIHTEVTGRDDEWLHLGFQPTERELPEGSDSRLAAEGHVVVTALRRDRRGPPGGRAGARRPAGTWHRGCRGGATVTAVVAAMAAAVVAAVAGVVVGLVFGWALSGPAPRSRRRRRRRRRPSPSRTSPPSAR